MRKAIKKAVLLSLPLFVACGGGSSKEPVNEAPTKVNLVAPIQNKLCIDNKISFDWTDATDANNDAVSYKIEFSTTRDMSSISKTQTTTSSNVEITLNKGVAYYWRVTPTDAKGLAGETSDVFAFYTKGEGETNSVPFAVKLVSPSNGATVAPVAISGIGDSTVTLKWKGGDADLTNGDVLKYDVYFGEDEDPTQVMDNWEYEQWIILVESGKTYYWKVNTTDKAGAKSIGQVWSFKVD